MEKVSYRNREDAIAMHLPLVKQIANTIHETLPPNAVSMDDLTQSGIVGLLKALERYNPAREVPFEIYARYRVRGEIMDHLRSLDIVSRSLRRWGRKIKTAQDTLVKKSGKTPSREETAQELGVPLKKYYKIEQKVSEAAVYSLEDISPTIKEELFHRESSEHFSLQDPAQIYEEKEAREKIHAYIPKLPGDELVVMRLYCDQELTLLEIGEILELSEARICQIFNEAVRDIQYLLSNGEFLPHSEGKLPPDLPLSQKEIEKALDALFEKS